MSRRDYRGSPLDGTVQHLSEAPYWQGEGETVDVVDDEPAGEERVEGVPTPGDEGPDEPGQSTLDDWGWSR